MEPKTSWQPGPAVCRCCLTEGCYKDISTEYFWMGKREVYADMLTETFDVNISYSASGGRLICESCISRLRDATEFKKQVVDCEKTFLQLLQPNSSGMLTIDVEPGASKPVKTEIELKLEKDDSDDDFPDVSHPFDDDDDDDELDVPLKNFATKVKEEPDSELLELLKRPGITAKRISTAKPKTSPAKKAKVTAKAGTDKPSSSKTSVKVVAKTPTKKAVAKVTTKDEKKKKVMKESSTVKLRNAKIFITCTTAVPFGIPFRKMACLYCWPSLEFEKPQELRDHVMAEHANNKALARNKPDMKVDCTDLRCLECDSAFVDVQEMAKHLRDIHEKDIKLDHDIDIHVFKFPTNQWTCAFCGLKFSSIKGLCRHTSTHYHKYACQFCDASFLCEANIRRHTRRAHQNTHKIFCNKCQIGLSDEEERLRHYEENKTCMPYLCSQCPERFMTIVGKRKHLESVHDMKPNTFKCIECNEVFSTINRYKTHFRAAHTDDFLCSYCGKRLSCKGNFIAHLAMHTCDKQFQCEVCLKSFATKKRLEQHSWMHKEDKRFECEKCHLKFNQLVSWKMHMKNHHRDITIE